MNAGLMAILYKYFLHYIDNEHTVELYWSEALTLGVLVAMTDPVEAIETIEELGAPH